jgi:hypothetical protein
MLMYLFERTLTLPTIAVHPCSLLLLLLLLCDVLLYLILPQTVKISTLTTSSKSIESTNEILKGELETLGTGDEASSVSWVQSSSKSGGCKGWNR